MMPIKVTGHLVLDERGYSMPISMSADFGPGGTDGNICTACMKRKLVTWDIRLGSIRIHLCLECLEAIRKMIGMELPDAKE